jgi:hypothetical protein
MQDGNRTRGKIVWGVLFRRLLDWRLFVNVSIYICELVEDYRIVVGQSANNKSFNCRPSPINIHDFHIHPSELVYLFTLMEILADGVFDLR